MASACRGEKLTRQDQNINRQRPENRRAAVRIKPSHWNNTLLPLVRQPLVGEAKRLKISGGGIRPKLVIPFG
jgi:hypothetical protein